jgi:uncharacterized membrane protein
MAPFIILLTSFLLLNVLGRLGIPFSFGWWTALRISLAAMFLLTASAHWGRRRADLIRMIPPGFPRPDLLTSITGVLEILGAIGLLIPAIAPYAGLFLSLFLLAVFPANVHAARQRLAITGRPVTPLAARTAMQVIFVAATMAVFIAGMR